MKWIEEKNGNKTTYKYVPDDYNEISKDTPQKDLTTGGATLIAMGMDKKDYDRIFGGKNELQKNNG